MLASTVDVLGNHAHAGSVGGVMRQLEQLREANHGIQRCAHFMAGARQEFRLGFARQLAGLPTQAFIGQSGKLFRRQFLLGQVVHLVQITPSLAIAWARPAGLVSPIGSQRLSSFSVP